MSKNRITIEQLNLVCRHYAELRAAGITENLGIRMVEHFADVYAKLHHGGSATPHHVEQVPRQQWSKAAIAFREQNPELPPRGHLVVEHGTPRRALARLVLDLHMQGRLDAASMDALVRQNWRLAVLTVAEDAALNRAFRSKLFDKPEDRWKAAGIEF